ncbi:ABC transporter permease [Ferruginivarius sediminum]|nr:ABC transporter permease [Ferruginivarius sediminum]
MISIESDLIEPCRLLYQRRHFVQDKIILDLRKRYSGSLLGMGWVLLVPLLFLGLYAMVHIVIHNISPNGMDIFDFSLMMFVGLMSVLGTAEPLAQATNSLPASRQWLLNLALPPQLLVAQMTMTGFTTCVIGLIVAIPVSLILDPMRWTAVFAPLVVMLQLLFVVGICWIMAIMAVLFKDLQILVRFISLALLIASPISYTWEMLAGFTKIFVLLNPISHYIILNQYLMVIGEFPPLEIVLSGTGIALGTFALGNYVVRRMVNVLADQF